MSLTVYVGPMFSGKTTALLKDIAMYSDITKCPCAIINSGLDERKTTIKGVSSHSSQYKGVSDAITVLSALKLSSLNIDKYTYIGIDEAQFFPDLLECVTKWLTAGKFITVASLDGTAEMKPFGQVAQLLPLSDSFTKLHARCTYCVKELASTKGLSLLDCQAAFSKKILAKNESDKESGKESGKTVIDVGGDDKYIATCRKHFYQAS